MWIIILTGMLMLALLLAGYPSLLLAAMRWRLRRACGLRQAYITNDGMRWSYLEGGTGPVVILLPGLGGNKYQWGLSFLKMTDSHRVIALDLPGGGDTTGELSGECTPQVLAQHIARVLDRLGVSTFTLIGASIGGYVAGTLAAQCGQRVEALVLINPAGLTSEHHTPVVRSFLSTGRHPFSYTTEEEMDALYAVLFSKPPVMASLLKRHLARRNARYIDDREKLLQGLRLAGFGGLSQALNGFQGPLLLVWGLDDKLLHGGSVQAMRAIVPHSKIVEVLDCGHLPYMEKPDVCGKEVRQFLTAI